MLSILRQLRTLIPQCQPKKLINSGNAFIKVVGLNAIEVNRAFLAKWVGYVLWGFTRLLLLLILGFFA